MVNPDGVAISRLQKLTPIRGRKRFRAQAERKDAVEFTEANPDKGTET